MVRQAEIRKQSPVPLLKEYFTSETERRSFVRHIFNGTPHNYDLVERVMSFGSGSWYRHKALTRAGLEKGMDVLDVAAGTGLVTRQALAIVGVTGSVTGLDPSTGMLQQARQNVASPLIQGLGEYLPCVNDHFDFLSMGYAIRHLANIEQPFAEFFRVLKAGGKICLLEISLPKNRIARELLKTYMQSVVPTLARVITRHQDTEKLMRFCWDTIATCVSPQIILDALDEVGFDNVDYHVKVGAFSEYTASKPFV